MQSLPEGVEELTRPGWARLAWSTVALSIVLAGCAHPSSSVSSLRFSGFAAALPTETVGAHPFVPADFEGRVVLLTFITTWCFPCLTELATLRRLEEEYHQEGFSNVLVGLDQEGRVVLEPFAAAYQLPFPILVGDDRLRSAQTPFGRLRDVPTRLLFGRSGEVLLAYTGVADFLALERRVVEALGR